MKVQSITTTDCLTVRFRGRAYAVPSVEAAADRWCEFRDAAMREGLGPDEIGSCLDVRDGGRRVARITWNGRTMYPTA